jgi:16S rRNA (cytidine1402-2'-O)-methyltransferase
MPERPEPDAPASADAGARPTVERGTIYVVATPIGNLDDVTLRALRVLGEVDLVAAEDTRHTRRLLDHHGIRARLIAYHDHVEAARAGDLVRRAQDGASIALVSDAGTPTIADPGYRLLRAAAVAGVRVVPIPGPSAPIALLSCAGLPTDRFTFAGFLPSRAPARRRVLRELADRPETLVFLESPHRIAATLADLAESLGARDVVLGRELTKRFEEIRRGTLSELASAAAQATGEGLLRGEIVLAVAGRTRAAGGAGDGGESAAASLDALLRAGLAAGTPVADLARAAAEQLAIPRRVAYQRALALKAAG